MKAFIFDLDGVLVFTDNYHFQAWKAMADEMGIPFTPEINDLLRGVSRMESLEIILRNYHGPALSEERKHHLAEEKNRRDRTMLAKMEPSDVSGDVLHVLHTLRSRGMKIALGSSSKNARFILERTGLLPLFDAISDGNTITRSKPDPEVFLKAAEFLGLPCDSCVVVEDARAGIDAAKAAGMMAAGIGDAKSYALTDYPLDNILQILDIIT